MQLQNVEFEEHTSGVFFLEKWTVMKNPLLSPAEFVIPETCVQLAKDIKVLESLKRELAKKQ